MRFETEPGRQLQIDFGQRRVWIGGEAVTVHLFVATLGYSRRLYVQAFDHQRQSAWLGGLEGAFRHFGGVPRELLVDNARPLVDHHDPATREARFNARFHAFCRYWGVQPKACAPYRARTCQVPCDHIPRSRERLFLARELIDVFLSCEEAV